MVAPSFVTVTSLVGWSAVFGRPLSEGHPTYTNIVHHHLVEAAGAEGALDDVRDSLRGKDYVLLAPHTKVQTPGRGRRCLPF